MQMTRTRELEKIDMFWVLASVMSLKAELECVEDTDPAVSLTMVAKIWIPGFQREGASVVNSTRS